MKKPEDYGSIMGINEEQYNELMDKIKLVQTDTYKKGYSDAIMNSINRINKMNDKFNKE
jgi:hypothetical protein